ncbi:MAG: M48 family metalloprotease [Terracidiphilus sp.]|jgi:predicted Zn-dependent protease
MPTLRIVSIAALAFALASPSPGQFGDLVRKAQEAKAKKDQADALAAKAQQAKDIYTPWSPQQEQQVGDATAAKVISIFGLYENPDMVKYVNLVGATVAQQATRPVPYRFGILDTEVITAISLPGGYIFITRGALANMHSEAELAGTLAHEVAHVDQRHLEKEIRSKSQNAFLKEQTAQYTSGQLLEVVKNSADQALTQSYSRDKESDADRLGLQFAARAGYEPDGLRLFLTFLASVPKTPETSKQLNLWGSTHPPFPERIESLTHLETAYPATGQVLDARFTAFINPAAFARN